MNLERDPVIGIVGGMGPQAGIALLNSISSCTGAITDQQHLSTILMSFPGHIGDRTAFLEGNIQLNPAFAIVDTICKLENAGAKIIGIACNTAHSAAIFDVILEELDKINSRVKLLNMVQETCQVLREYHPHVRRVGVMTTDGTYKSGLYTNLLRSRGYEGVLPDPAFQTSVIHRIIYDPEFGLKARPDAVAPEVKDLLAMALRYFSERKTDLIVLGCTELSLLLKEDMGEQMLMVDSTRSLARGLIREATAHHSFNQLTNQNTCLQDQTLI